jgi:outer membrane receptor protein involved in Fe transport
MNFKSKYLCLPLVISFLSFPALSAESTSDSATTLDEIIVTARKREESLLDISESVSAISGSDIDARNIKGLDKIGLLIPNLNLAKRADGYPNVSIRGIGAFGLTQGVGFYLDDVQLFSDASSRFGDLDRIEVLKGPQGILYGGSNIGGAVKFVSKRPSVDEGFTGRVKYQVGQQSINDAEISANIPLQGDWAMRVFSYTRDDDGFITNPNSDGVDNQPVNIDKYSEDGTRISIVGSLSDNLSLYASVRRNEYNGPVNTWARELGQPGSFFYPKQLDTGTNSSRDAETTAATLELNWSLDGFDITTITSQTDTESTRITDVDLTQFWYFNTTRPEEMDVLTQEIRFTSTTDSNLQWIFGAYMSDYERTMDSFLTFGPDALGLGFVFAMPFEKIVEENTHNALFGSISYEVDQWRYDFGLRYDKWEETELNLDSETNGAVHGGKIDDTETLPRVSITRSFENGSIAYFTTSQGYEPGGLNNGVPYTDGNGNKLLGSFGKEEALQNELGWKGTMNEGRTSLSVAYFDIEYKDRAFQVVAPNPGGPGLIEYVTNIGDSDQNGLELELTTQATDNLVLSFAAGFVNSDFADGTILADGTDLSGVTPPATIDKSFLFAADYSNTLSNGTEMTLGAQWSFTGQGVGMPVVGALKNPSYKVLNLQAGFVNGPWDFMLTLDNALNEDYYTDMEVFPNLSNDQAVIGDTFIIGTYGVQKLFQASLTYNF